MNTLTINSKAALTLARATERAKAEKPLVKKTCEYGVYEVRSSDKTRWYTVKCVSATREISCNCSSRKPCKHIAAVAPLHSYIARQKQEAEKAAQQAAPEAEPMQPVCGCGKDAYAHFNGTWHCIDCVKEKQAQITEAERLYPDLLEPIYQADAEYKAARAQAELALAALAASGFQPTKPGEETQSMDRHCPSCGLVQPDDDSSDCLACGAVLDPEDEYTDAQADYDRACLFG